MIFIIVIVVVVVVDALYWFYMFIGQCWSLSIGFSCYGCGEWWIIFWVNSTVFPVNTRILQPFALFDENQPFNKVIKTLSDWFYWNPVVPSLAVTPWCNILELSTMFLYASWFSATWNSAKFSYNGSFFLSLNYLPLLFLLLLFSWNW